MSSRSNYEQKIFELLIEKYLKDIKQIKFLKRANRNSFLSKDFFLFLRYLCIN